MNTQQTHGIISLGLTSVALVIAALAMFLSSWGLGVAYVAICLIAPQAIIYAFCAKCPCKECCGHVLPGKQAMAFNRQPGPYTPVELGILGVVLLLLFGLPQFWLWQYPKLFIAFWILSAIAFMQIRLVVCRACNNIHCPLKGKN
jgi:hypothetical protein